MADENETLNGVDVADVVGGSVVEMDEGTGRRQAEVDSAEPPMMRMRMPQSEEEAQAMLAAQLGNDPDKIRQAAEATYQQMQAVADALDVKQGRTPRKVATVTTETLVEVKDLAVNKQPEAPTFTANIETRPTVASLEAAKPPMPATPIVEPTKPATSEPVKPALVHPPGYQLLGDGLYTWSPDMWGGLPLHFCPDRTIEAKDRPTLIVGVLVAPAYGRNRMGRIVKLPEGARIVVYAGIAWMPIALLARGTEGRPIVYAVPTTIDRSGGIPIVKMASHKDDKLVKYETGDGGHEYGVAILYDPDPENPKLPRMVSLETLRSAQQAVEP